MRIYFFILLFVFSTNIFGQTSEALKLLDKSIQYHDPTDQWATFNDFLFLAQEIPEKPIRYTEIYIDNAYAFFSHSQKRNDSLITQIVHKDACSYKLHDEFIDSVTAQKLKLNCERTSRIRDYHLYLYGLPMKLKDPGTIIHPDVTETTFLGNEVLSIKVNYESNVGEDTWYFYFEPKTSKLVGYRFFHDESINDGEYISLAEEKIIGKIKIPSIRTWYVNKDDRLLGVDILQ